MELIEAIRTRRTIRRYDERPVDKTTIEELLNIAVLAPSASNSQPWLFGVVQGVESLQRYSDRAKAMCIEANKANPDWQRYNSMLSNPAFNIFYNASTVVCVYARPMRNPFAKTDCAMAAYNLMLAAHDLGLATVWVGFAHWLFDSPEMRQELGVPAEYSAVGQFALGYPAGSLPSPTTRKPPEILFWR